MSLYVVEMRRAVHRRVVWVLIAIALAGCAAAGLIVFFDSAGRTVAETSKAPAVDPTFKLERCRDFTGNYCDVK